MNQITHKFMKSIVAILTLCTCVCPSREVELKSIAFSVVEDQRAYQRPEQDKRSCVWTDTVAGGSKLLESFGITNKKLLMKEGQVLAIFLTEPIHEDLTAIVFNSSVSETFADFADSGLRMKMSAPEEGKKYTHLTAVVFTPVQAVKNIGVRRMVEDAVSEKSSADPK
jgi:hypothetical protein